MQQLSPANAKQSKRERETERQRERERDVPEYPCHLGHPRVANPSTGYWAQNPKKKKK